MRGRGDRAQVPRGGQGDTAVLPMTGNALLLLPPHALPTSAVKALKQQQQQPVPVLELPAWVSHGPALAAGVQTPWNVGGIGFWCPF